ncbi:MAG: KpsF/GutQ family sugar-phosphate isomerase [Alphaproteobacteria bacterium]
MTHTDLAEARRLLTAEAAALTTVAEKLDDSFSRAVDILFGLKGRVIVTGMGKSGHIGAKMAATFASTGTPAFFVHPGEASHGDLGMMTANDAVIALSHSGESRELQDILAYCGRYSIPLIAITGKPASTLAKAATVVLLNHVAVEACPIGMAPTSSTTVSLALGDALATALMVRRGFKKEDFSRYHPGGKLGAQLLKVSDVMVSADLPTVTATTPMNAALITLTTKNLGCVAIVDSQKLLGIFTDGDLKRHIAKPNFLQQQVGELMTANPITITPTAFATQAVKLMQDKKITTVLVAENGILQGVLHINQCLAAGIV